LPGVRRPPEKRERNGSAARAHRDDVKVEEDGGKRRVEVRVKKDQTR